MLMMNTTVPHVRIVSSLPVVIVIVGSITTKELLYITVIGYVRTAVIVIMNTVTVVANGYTTVTGVGIVRHVTSDVGVTIVVTVMNIMTTVSAIYVMGVVSMKMIVVVMKKNLKTGRKYMTQ